MDSVEKKSLNALLECLRLHVRLRPNRKISALFVLDRFRDTLYAFINVLLYLQRDKSI